MFSTLLSWLRSETTRGRRPPRPKAARRSPFRARVEALEDRTVPSNLPVLGTMPDGLTAPSLGAASQGAQHTLDAHHVGIMSNCGHHKGNGGDLGGGTFP